jgi:hypothetical protein
MTERRRLIELALQALEQEQVRIQQEMTALRAELTSGTPARTNSPVTTAHGTSPNKGKNMSAAQKRKISLALKRRWAERRKLTKAA